MLLLHTCSGLWPPAFHALSLQIPHDGPTRGNKQLLGKLLRNKDNPGNLFIRITMGHKHGRVAGAAETQSTCMSKPCRDNQKVAWTVLDENKLCSLHLTPPLVHLDQE
jgi:hypothetical protein